MKLVTAAQMREIDRIAISERGIAAAELLEQAGRAIARGVADFVEPGVVVVFCGKGNNGGDGFVAARYLARNGFSVVVIPALGTSGFSPETQTAYDQLSVAGVKILPLPEQSALAKLLEDADAIVDAILGTGSRSQLEQPLDWVVQTMNASNLPIIAADLPTGLDATTGEVQTVAVRAALTVTIGLPKLGMTTVSGINHCGQVRVDGICFPQDLLQNPELNNETVKLAEAARLLPERPLDANKGTFGLVTICAGSRWMPGAAALAVRGALRSGAGLVRVYAPNSILDLIAPQLPEALLFGHDEDFAETLTPLNDDQLDDLMTKTSALVVGPGMGQSLEARDFLSQVLSFVHVPTVLDADALNLIAKDESLRKRLHSNCLLTPHPGELARLLGCSTEHVQQNRWEAAERAVKMFGCTVILKGFGSLVASKAENSRGVEVVHIPSGNTALSRGGSGDVLAGLLGGLLAQGMGTREAGILGTFVWGLAADLLVRDASSRGLIISDMIEALPKAFRELEKSQRTGSLSS